MSRWTPLRLIVVGVVVAMAVAACSLIPPQNIGDIFGLDGRTATLTPVPGGAALSTAAFTSCDDADGTHCDDAFLPTESFSDPDVPGWVANLINGMEVDAGIDSTIAIDMEAGASFPGQVTVSKLALSLTLEDLESGKTVSFAGTATASPAVVFAETGTEGTYQATNVDPLSLTITVPSADLNTARDILTAGGENVGSGVLVLTVAEPNIASITVETVSEGTTLSP